MGYTMYYIVEEVGGGFEELEIYTVCMYVGWVVSYGTRYAELFRLGHKLI